MLLGVLKPDEREGRRESKACSKAGSGLMLDAMPLYGMQALNSAMRFLSSKIASCKQKSLAIAAPRIALLSKLVSQRAALHSFSGETSKAMQRLFTLDGVEVYQNG